MKQKRITGMVFAALATMGLVSGGSMAADPIKIGVITDRVGNSAAWAKPMEEGMELAVEELNGKGGVLGRKIELVYESDQSKPDVSATKARKLIDDGVVAILSITVSPATQQAQTVTAEAKVVHMTPANSADYLTTKLDNPYFFQMGPLGSTQIKTLMAYNTKKNYKKVAIVKDNSGLGTYLGSVFRKSLEAAGAEIVAEETIEAGATDAVAQLQKVRAANPEAIYNSGIVVSSMSAFFKAYHQLGMKQPILGSFNLSVPKYLEVIPGMMEGVAFIDVFDPDKPEAKAFSALYEKKYGSKPFSLPAYGYDGVRVLADAITRAGSTDSEKLRAAMASTTGWVGVLGAKGEAVDFARSRAGFPLNGAVVRVIENNTHGPVVHAGTGS